MLSGIRISVGDELQNVRAYYDILEQFEQVFSLVTGNRACFASISGGSIVTALVNCISYDMTSKERQIEGLCNKM